MTGVRDEDRKGVPAGDARARIGRSCRVRRLGLYGAIANEPYGVTVSEVGVALGAIAAYNGAGQYLTDAANLTVLAHQSEAHPPLG